MHFSALLLALVGSAIAAPRPQNNPEQALKSMRDFRTSADAAAQASFASEMSSMQSALKAMQTATDAAVLASAASAYSDAEVGVSASPQAMAAQIPVATPKTTPATTPSAAATPTAAPTSSTTTSTVTVTSTPSTPADSLSSASTPSTTPSSTFNAPSSASTPVSTPSSTPSSGSSGSSSGQCGVRGSSAKVINQAAFQAGATTDTHYSSNLQASPSYQCYEGASANFPDPSKWTSLDAMWAANQNSISHSCSGNSWGTDNTDQQNQWLKQSITDVAGESSVDARFILAIVMQESQGCINVPTTNNGVVNPGLMQSHNGASWQSCQDQGQACIKQMISDGVQGTDSGNGLVQYLNGGATEFEAARLYNSGKVDKSNLNDGISSTPTYVVDVANRLTGWSGEERQTCSGETRSGSGSGESLCGS